MEIARILVFHSSILLPTGGFIPLGNAAVSMWAFNKSCRGLAMVLTSKIALWPQSIWDFFERHCTNTQSGGQTPT